MQFHISNSTTIHSNSHNVRRVVQGNLIQRIMISGLAHRNSCPSVEWVVKSQATIHSLDTEKGKVNLNFICTTILIFVNLGKKRHSNRVGERSATTVSNEWTWMNGWTMGAQRHCSVLRGYTIVRNWENHESEIR